MAGGTDNSDSVARGRQRVGAHFTQAPNQTTLVLDNAIPCQVNAINVAHGTQARDLVAIVLWWLTIVTVNATWTLVAQAARANSVHRRHAQ